MQIHEIRIDYRPEAINVSGAESMIARSEARGSAVWVALGTPDEFGKFKPIVNLFLDGPNAFDKSVRLQAGINSALAEPDAVNEPVSPAIGAAAE